MGIEQHTGAGSASLSEPRIGPWNPFVEFSRNDLEQSIGIRFQQVVDRDPSRVAIKMGQRVLTYGTLNEMANRVAHVLRSKNGADNAPVAVFGGNDVGTIASILGVLKAGKIYVPLDTSFSEAWAKFILEDTKTRMIVIGTDDSTLPDSWLTSAHVVIGFESLERSSAVDPGVPVSSDALCQILYTSGSTGKPKGVMENHRNMLHNAMRLTNALHVSSEDRFTLVRPPTTGGGLCNLLLALLNGATVYPVNFRKMEVEAMADWLGREKITILHAGAMVFRHFAQHLHGGATFPELRLIRVGSGQIFDQDVKLFQHWFPNALLLHILSCTEVNTYRAYFVNKDSNIPAGPLPVGYALNDMEVLILDDGGRVANRGEIGEIAVRSGYLFPGYWNDPALTNSAFIEIANSNRRRTFRTGDMGRLHHDGCLEYLGRKDFRLKIRGHRIHAEEVEFALLRLPEIREAVIMGQKDIHGDDRLIAYLTFVENQRPTVNQIRKALGKWLSDYMIPSRFVFLDKMPLTSSGKVNREALPAIQPDRPYLSTPFNAPTTPLESAITNIWMQALGINTIGTSDSFFDLGGDSLVASRIVAAINRIYPWNLSLGEFYSACSVQQLARGLEKKAPNPTIANKVANVYLRVARMSDVEVENFLAAERERRLTK